MRLIQANEPAPERRLVYFHIVQSDGITPATDEAGGQPQISVNGAPWTASGISALTAIGNGRYYAKLNQATVSPAGIEIETRYASAATAETPGDSVQVTAFDPAGPVGPPGAVAVDQDYGGDDSLTVVTEAGAGIDGATIRAYLASDYAAGNTGAAFIVSQTLTDVAGHWVTPMLLDPGNYTLLIFRQGLNLARVVPLTVTAS